MSPITETMAAQAAIKDTIKLETTSPTTSNEANSETIPLNTLLRLIPDFDTAQPAQVYRFVRSCDSAFELANASQQPVILTYTLNRISGQNSSDIFAKRYQSWSELKTFLIQKFSQTKTLTHLNLELQSLFQKPNESVTDYFHRVDLCRNKILDKLTAEVSDASLIGRKTSTEETALSIFVNGVSSNLGSMLRTKGFTTLSEAGTFAIQEEKIQNMNHARQVLFRTPAYSSTIRRPTPPINQTQSSLSTAQPNTFRPTKTCNYCKKPGHLISECRKRAYNNNIKNHNIERPTNAPLRINNLNLQAAEETGFHSGTASIYCPNTPMTSSRQNTAPELYETMQNLQLQ
ncbi:uncharacterized protein LOC133528252 [Cydia pomonella]|uniref:uncharacterized protein LOC133515607 n=1 Tax=Cydia pomonella TaxID=82600 RepID=UPI002ADE6618|nr:uncharacterized protein LOC133515607 [Cydia pomonella]XP_061706835.1 uncharacterized protein LOC133517521 [Cydia pomonella]XP_061712389.1 uncharacterized protein LOC133521444 [Cydia pomonella]XP_061712592.1 uncharacterized protein LOC133521574 [Cydia pomonella]XP_061721243.1 uncharacterized protein LOC133528053 [Cydia pomonella]XP_061721537.1 uncharacterized protein LOC133528252 [Cydia pomonella]